MISGVSQQLEDVRSDSRGKARGPLVGQRRGGSESGILGEGTNEGIDGRSSDNNLESCSYRPGRM